MTSTTSKHVNLSMLNPHITCKLCGGYFIDATTVTECLHTFCRSCIVKHFKKSLFCPECDVQVERGCPLNKLRPDPRKQLLVYKVVPRLHQNEIARQWNFLKQNQPHRGPRPLLPGDLPEETVRDRIVDKIHVYAPEDKISLSVEYESCVPFGPVNGCPPEKIVNSHKRYLQCPAALTVFHLKKFIRLKYEISPQHKILISYEGETLPDDSSLMDIAYQFFYEAKSPMRFTYRITPGAMLAVTEDKPKPVPSRSPPRIPTVVVKPTPAVQKTSAARHQKRGSASSAASSSDESTASTRRHQRQRSAKTAAYNAMEAMEESEHEEDLPSKRRRLSGKSPRWGREDDSPEPFTVYRNTRRTPKATLEDLEARYNIKTERRRVYAGCSEDELSDDETRKNTLANKKVTTKYNGSIYSSMKTLYDSEGRPKSVLNGKFRKKKIGEDVYEFDAHNEDNEDSNSTEEYDFVYDNSDHEDTLSQGEKRKVEISESKPMLSQRTHENRSIETNVDMHDLEADEHELEQHIEMEVVTDTDDIDQHIEDSIEEVEVDADDNVVADDAGDKAEAEAAEGDGMDDETDDNQLEAETTSSTCLVIAEDDDDDGVVEEVIAAEEDGHELVVVEEESDATYTVEVINVPPLSNENSEKLSEDASLCSDYSPNSKSPTVEEDEPEIVHEKVFRKKSKKSKHHHHHHHHKRKRHHSPVMLISSPEEAPMKLTLKLRPTPSISPGSSTPRHSSSKSPLPDFKDTKLIIGLSSPSRGEVNGGDSPKSPTSSEWSHKYNSQKVYTVKKAPSPKVTSPNPENSERKFLVTPDSRSSQSPQTDSAVAKTQSVEVTAPKAACCSTGNIEHQNTLPSASPKAASTYPRQPTPPKEDTATDKRSVPEEVKERLTQMRQVRHKLSPNTVPYSTASTVTSATSSVPDLKSVKTPSSLVISKVEAGETPRRAQEPSKKPALEILMLPPSPPPQEKLRENPESTEKNGSKVEVTSTFSGSSNPIQKKLSPKSEPRPLTSDQSCVLDLSGKARREEVPKASVPKPLIASPQVSPNKSKVPSPTNPSREISIRSDLTITPTAELNLMPNPQLLTIQNLMNEATIATMNRMMGNNQLAPILTPFCGQTMNNVNNQQRRLPPLLNDLYVGRRVGGFDLPASRPGPNQSVRHIPNPSALFNRQQSHFQQSQAKLLQDNLNKQGQLTEEQLKERYQQFQQNRAARAAFTYSRVSAPGNNRNRNTLTSSASGVSSLVPTISSSVSSTTPNHHNNNNNISVKTAIRSRSIEKVAAGLLSVRSGAYAVEAQVGH